jgi:hypothetical protein
MGGLPISLIHNPQQPFEMHEEQIRPHFLQASPAF